MGWNGIRAALTVTGNWNGFQIHSALSKHKSLAKLVEGVKQDSRVNSALTEVQIQTMQEVVEN
jgi:hypothetical protein